MFNLSNKVLDASYTQFNAKGGANSSFQRKRSKIESGAVSFVSQLPKECSFNSGSAPLTPEQLRRAVMLIKTLDAVLKIPDRKPEKYTPGMIQAAVDVGSRYSEEKIVTILCRLNLKKNTGMRNETGSLLEKFDELVVRIMPNDGYVKWLSDRSKGLGLKYAA